MASVNAQFRFVTKMSEDITSPTGLANVFDYSAPERIVNGNSQSNPDMDEVYIGNFTLVGGTLAVDLTTSLARTGRTPLDLTGKTVYGYRIDNTSTASLNFIVAVANGYPMITDLDIGAGGTVQGYQAGGFTPVDATHKAITVTGAGTETFRLALIAGTA